MLNLLFSIRFYYFETYLTENIWVLSCKVDLKIIETHINLIRDLSKCSWGHFPLETENNIMETFWINLGDAINICLKNTSVPWAVKLIKQAQNWHKLNHTGILVSKNLVLLSTWSRCNVICAKFLVLNLKCIIWFLGAWMLFAPKGSTNLTFRNPRTEYVAQFNDNLKIKVIVTESKFHPFYQA